MQVLYKTHPQTVTYTQQLELETACCVTFCKNVYHHSSYLVHFFNRHWLTIITATILH